MASAMRKMAVYLGLVEDDRRYDDELRLLRVSTTGYEAAGRDWPERDARRARRTCWQATWLLALPAWLRRRSQATDLTRITTLHPRTYNEARTIGEHFREGTPVIMNLTEMVDSDAKRLVDFAAGLIFGLRGQHRACDEQGLPAVTGERRGDGRGQGADRRARLLQPELGTP